MPLLSVLHRSIDEMFVGHCWVQRPGNKELAGHKELSKTQRYMHLSPAALDTAVRLLDFPKSVWTGEAGETANSASAR
jgi:hypothetical protein